jgi:hypothetical protein
MSPYLPHLLHISLNSSTLDLYTTKHILLPLIYSFFHILGPHFAQKAFSFSGTSLWRSLPSSIWNCTNFSTFSFFGLKLFKKKLNINLNYYLILYLLVSACPTFKLPISFFTAFIFVLMLFLFVSGCL